MHSNIHHQNDLFTHLFHRVTFPDGKAILVTKATARSF
jgi:hypothetical protein